MKSLPSSLQLRLQAIAPFNARTRGIRRLNPPGVGLHWNRCRASADIWITADAVILLRFSSGRFRQSWHVEMCSSRGSIPPEDFLEVIRKRLEDWFYDVLE